MWPSNFIPRYLTKKNDNICLQKDSHLMFTAVFFLIAPNWKQLNESQQLSANSREPWHKRLHAGWFDLCEITERAALKWQKVDQCLPRARGSGTGSDCSESKNVSRWWKHCVWWLRWWLHCCKSLSGFLFCTPNCSEFIVYKYTPIQLTKRKKKYFTFTPGPTPESPLNSDLLTMGYEEYVILSYYLMLQSPFLVETLSAVMLWMVSW